MAYDRDAEYLSELLAEKESLHPSNVHAARLIAQEIDRIQTGTNINPQDKSMVELHNDKPMNLISKVRVPVREYPKVNFPGRMIGPKGVIMRQFQEKTGVKLQVFGRGSMSDKAKEEELRQVGGKYSHLNEELHVKLEAYGHPVECHRRMSYAMHELRQYLGPDEPSHANGGQFQARGGFTQVGPRGVRPVAFAGGAANESWSQEAAGIGGQMIRGARPAFQGGGPRATSNIYASQSTRQSAGTTNYGAYSNALEESEEDEYTAAPLSAAADPSAAELWYDEQHQQLLSATGLVGGAVGVVSAGGGGKITSYQTTATGQLRTHPYQTTNRIHRIANNNANTLY